jgi:hypothetical protein
MYYSIHLIFDEYEQPTIAGRLASSDNMRAEIPQVSGRRGVRSAEANTDEETSPCR